MANHLKPAHISLFPGHINREYFAAFLSGFAAGEGCFTLMWQAKRRKGTARFCIEVRHDERETLELIQSFLACGYIHYRPERKYGIISQPQNCYMVGSILDLQNIIVPHFEKYPMLAKKNGDFQIWKEAVYFLRRKRDEAMEKRHKCNKERQTWFDEDRSIFRQFMTALREQRQCNVDRDPNT